MGSTRQHICLDGTTLEGGGQLLRIAIGLSALTKKPIRITNIRGNRFGGGGLKLQHLTGVQWLAKASGARTSGAERKSKILDFWSQEHDKTSAKISLGGKRVEKVIDIGSPGAIGLVFQAILPYILFSGCVNDEATLNLTIKGGTNVSNSPSIDYIQQVLLPMLGKIGLPPIDIRLHSRGWSTGRNEIGAVTFEIRPLAIGTSLLAFNLTDRGQITKITATILGTRASEKHFHRELVRAAEEAFPNTELEINFEFSGHEKRLYLLLVAHTSYGLRLGRDWLFSERISSLDNAVPKLVSRVVEDLASEIKHGGCVDEFMRDQLVVFQSLSNGRSEVFGGRNEEGNLLEASLHAKTAQWVAEEVLGISWGDDGRCESNGFVCGGDHADGGDEQAQQALQKGMRSLRV